jgi:hypothetical protein
MIWWLMALDRFINWNKNKPNKDEMILCLDEFCETDPYDSIMVLSHMDDRFFISFVPDEGAWIEVWHNNECADVITRLQSKETNDIAADLTEFIKNKFDGTLGEM